jgi:hypothetical protein
MIEDQLQVIAHLLVETWFHGEAKNRTWWRGQLRKPSIVQWLLVKDPIILYCDNKAAINIANNPVQHD